MYSEVLDLKKILFQGQLYQPRHNTSAYEKLEEEKACDTLHMVGYL